VAGNDDRHCTAPMAGAEDESFVHAVLGWLRQRSQSAFATYPTYLYGHSGGGRMALRIACNSTLGQRLAGVFVSSGLLPADLRSSAPPTCHVSTMPPLIVTHGTGDKITNISFEDESMAWLAAAAKCSSSSITAGVGKDPVAELIHHAHCRGARPGFQIAYYRLQDAPHNLPSIFWYGVALNYWTYGVGPGIKGYDAIRAWGVAGGAGAGAGAGAWEPSAGRGSAGTSSYHVVLFLVLASICLLGVARCWARERERDAIY
jgi:hypothetical protein